MAESWRVIKKFPDYEVSDAGGVRKSKTKEPVRAYWASDGYQVLLHYKPHLNARRQFVHRLVAAAHIGDVSDDNVVWHKDRNKKNSTASNLEIITKSECFRRR